MLKSGFFCTILFMLFSGMLYSQESDMDQKIAYKFTISKKDTNTYKLTSSFEAENIYVSERSLQIDTYYAGENFYNPIDKFTWQFNEDEYDKDDVSFLIPEFEDVFLSSDRVYYFRIPEVIKKGDVVKYKYTSKYDDIAYFPVINIPDTDSLISFKLEIEHPEEIVPELTIAFARDTFKYNITSSPLKTVFEAGPFTHQDELEFFQPQDLLASIFVSLMKDGKSINPSSAQEFTDWYSTLTPLKPTLDSSDMSILQDTISRENDKLQKLKIIYDYVRNNFRYIAEEQDSCSIIARAPSVVLKRKYADCKERAALVIAIAKQNGIDVNYALVASEDAPGIAKPFVTKYNHMICAYDNGNEVMFFDPTSRYCEFGNIPGNDIGREALILDPVNARSVIIHNPRLRPSIEVHIDAFSDSLEKAEAHITLRNDYYTAALHAKNELTGVKLENFLSNTLTSNFYKISLDYFDYEKEDSASITFKAIADISQFLVSSAKGVYIPKTPFIYSGNDLSKRKNDNFRIVLNTSTHSLLEIVFNAPSLQTSADSLIIGIPGSNLFYKTNGDIIDSNKSRFTYEFFQKEIEFINENKTEFISFCEAYLKNKTNMFILKRKNEK